MLTNTIRRIVMKKLILPILLALITAFSMTACGQSEKTTSYAQPTQPSITDKSGTGYNVQDDGTLTVSSANKESKEISVPESFQGKKVTKLAKSAFKMCKAEKITLPESVKSIDDYTFAFCRDLKEIKLPSKIKKIGQNCFAGCSSLKTLKLPEGIKTIDIFAFDGSGLESITIPEAVKTVKSFAFAECEGLKEVIFEGKSTEIEEKAFKDSDSVTITAPKGSAALTYAEDNNISCKAKK